MATLAAHRQQAEAGGGADERLKAMVLQALAQLVARAAERGATPDHGARLLAAFAAEQPAPSGKAPLPLPSR